MRLTVIVLGSAAGGGYPQWNCRCDVCRLAWDRDPRVSWRTQTSVAVSADGMRWVLINASPDLRAQIAQTKHLQPKQGLRTTAIDAVILTGAEIDQVAGLLNLREQQAFGLHASADALAWLGMNPMFDALAPGLVKRHATPLDETFSIVGLEFTLFAVPGKFPLYMETDRPNFAADGGANVGIEIAAGGVRVAFVPGAAEVTHALRERLGAADLIFFDGTLFTDDEMQRNRTGTKSGRRMGHVPIDGPGGSLQALSGLTGRRIYIHINNTNPILVAGSSERCRLEAAGWEIAFDGMELVL